MKPLPILVGNLVDIIGTNVAAIVVMIAMKVVAMAFGGHLSGPVLEFLQNPAKQHFVLQGVGILCSIVGGYVAAQMAKEKELLYGASSAILCTAFGVYAMVKGHHYEPKVLLLEPLSLVLGTLGGYLYLRRSKRS
jgi:hypothetical protein